MSIDLGTEQINLKKEERTQQIRIQTFADTDPLLTIFREVVYTTDQGDRYFGARDIVVERRLSEIADKHYTVGEYQFTGAQLAGIISAVADLLRAEDLQKAETV